MRRFCPRCDLITDLPFPRNSAINADSSRNLGNCQANSSDTTNIYSFSLLCNEKKVYKILG